MSVSMLVEVGHVQHLHEPNVYIIHIICIIRTKYTLKTNLYIIYQVYVPVYHVVLGAVFLAGSDKRCKNVCLHELNVDDVDHVVDFAALMMLTMSLTLPAGAALTVSTMLGSWQTSERGCMNEEEFE